MTDVSTLEAAETVAVEKDPNRTPHLLCALDKYLMQNPQKSLVDVVLGLSSELGRDVGSLTDEEITSYLKEKATKW